VRVGDTLSDKDLIMSNFISGHVDDAAEVCAGNHRDFESFGWGSRPDDDENWMIVNVSSRDSGLVEESNAAVYERELHWNDEKKEHPFGDDVVSESHNHWACGYVNALVIRVYKEGTKDITEAFECWHGLYCAQSDYPLLDDSDHSAREYEAQHTAIENCSNVFDNDPPKGWVNDVWGWLWDNDQSCQLFDYCEGEGPYANDDDVCKALDGLGIEYEDD